MGTSVLKGTLLLFFIFLSGCASRTAGWEKSHEKIKFSPRKLKHLRSQALSHWNKRHIKKQLELALKEYELLSRATEKNRNYFLRLARGYYFMAQAHAPIIDDQKRYWDMAAGFAEKALAKNKLLAQQLDKGEDIDDHLDKLNKSDLAAMYWNAINLSFWSKNSGLATTLKYKKRIEVMMEKVEKKAPHYFYGAVYRYWGRFYAYAASYSGGSLEKSKDYYMKAIKVAPDYLLSKVLYAQNNLIQAGDEEEFKKILNEVIKAKIKRRSLFPENFIAKLKAKKLLETMESLF